jgi:GDP-mannose transporter
MVDKKDEDYETRLPEQFFRDGEKQSFLGGPGGQAQGRQVGQTFSVSKIDNSPGLSILAYCLSSISMTVVNKYVVSGSSWNLNLFYLAVQVIE